MIETKNYHGEIKGGRKEKYWTVSNRFQLYNPRTYEGDGGGVLKKYSSLPFVSLVSFTMRCRFSIDPELRKIESDELVVYDVELSGFIQRKLVRLKMIKGAPLLTNEQISDIYQQRCKYYGSDNSRDDVQLFV